MQCGCRVKIAVSGGASGGRLHMVFDGVLKTSSYNDCVNLWVCAVSAYLFFTWVSRVISGESRNGAVLMCVRYCAPS